MITGDRLELGHNPERHVGYVRSWVRALRDDPREIYRASRDAQQMSDWTIERVRGRAPEHKGRRAGRGALRRAQSPGAVRSQTRRRSAAGGGEQQRLFQRERAPEGRFAPGR